MATGKKRFGKVLFFAPYDMERWFVQRPHHGIDYLKTQCEELHVVTVDAHALAEREILFDPAAARFRCDVRREGHVTHYRLPVPLLSYSEPVYLLVCHLFREYLIHLFRGRNFEFCLMFGPFAGALTETVRREGIASFVVYEDLDDFAGFHPEEPGMTELFGLLEYVAVAGGDGVFCVSRLLREFRLETISPGDHIHVCENGVILDVFAKAQEVERTDPMAIYVGSVEPWAGVDLAIRAMPEVREKVPGATLEIVGDGPDTLPLKKMSREMGLEDCVFFLGKKPYRELYKELGRAKVALITFRSSNLTRVAFPLKLAEYAAAGLPMVGSDFGEIAAFIRGNEVGLTAGGEEEIAQGLVRLFTDEPLRRRFARAAVETARRYDWPVLFSEEFARVREAIDLSASPPRPPDYDAKVKEIDRRVAAVIERLRSRYPGIRSLLAEKALRWSAEGRKKIYLYGAGEHTEKLLDRLTPLPFAIEGIFDADPAKRGVRVRSLAVYSRDEIDELRPDVVIISSKAYEKEILADLRARGVPETYPLYAASPDFAFELFAELYYFEPVKDAAV